MRSLSFSLSLSPVSYKGVNVDEKLVDARQERARMKDGTMQIENLVRLKGKARSLVEFSRDVS